MSQIKPFVLVDNHNYFQIRHIFQMLHLYSACSITFMTVLTRRPASADRTARRQFQAVFPVITSSFPTNVIAHLHALSMDLTVGRTVGPTLDSTVELLD